MRLYLSGKITGNENYKEDFSGGRITLEKAGYDVCDPTTFDLPEDVSWEEAMKYDIHEMLRCDGVALLPNWKESKGACIEARLAMNLGMKVMPVLLWVNEAGKYE